MKFSLISKLLLLVISIYSTRVFSIRVVCYFENQMQYSQGNVNYTTDDINTTLCTHLVYNYVTIDFDTEETEINLEESKKYEQFVDLKLKNPQLKLMISHQCWNYELRTLVNNKEVMTRMMKNIVQFLHQFKFHGLELDTRFCKKDLISYFVEVFGQNNLESNKLLFSIAADNNYINSISQSEVTRLKKNLDFINIHTYEFRRPQDPQADHHSPLYSRTWDTNLNMNIDSVVNKWIHKGFPSDKIVIGIPLFGISWTLSSYTITPPAPATGPGNLLITKARNRDGYIPYYEICHAVRYKSWKMYPKNEKMGPYAVSPYDYNSYRTWVGYDDPAMAIVKSEYILSKGIGGAAVADVNMDDFINSCGKGFNPMMTAIYDTFFKDKHPKIEIPEDINSTTQQNNETSSTLIETETTIQFDSGTSPSSFDETSDNNPTCDTSRIDFTIPSVVFAFLFLTLVVVLAKIFCVKNATQ